jgi:hypothetical protein
LRTLHPRRCNARGCRHGRNEFSARAAHPKRGIVFPHAGRTRTPSPPERRSVWEAAWATRSFSFGRQCRSGPVEKAASSPNHCSVGVGLLVQQASFELVAQRDSGSRKALASIATIGRNRRSEESRVSRDDEKRGLRRCSCCTPQLSCGKATSTTLLLPDHGPRRYAGRRGCWNQEKQRGMIRSRGARPSPDGTVIRRGLAAPFSPGCGNDGGSLCHSGGWAAAFSSGPVQGGRRLRRGGPSVLSRWRMSPRISRSSERREVLLRTREA